MPSRLALLLVFFVCPSARSAGGGTITYTVNVSAGWNLLSLPVQVADGASGTVFPDAISNAIIFNGGYASLDTLKKGLGFWMKFASADTIPVAGGGMFIDSLNLRAGWNLIGGLTTPVAVNLIVTEPPGIVGSKFFRYVPGSGYAQTDTLQPGYGYWVRANRAGRLHMMARNVPCPGLATLAYGGRTYHTVQIGEQCWFRENLDIGEWVEGGVPQEDNGLTEKYCFNDEVVNCLYYGGLYQWNEAMQFSTAEGAQGICPPGWHVPTQGGFTELISSVRGDGNALKALRQGLEDGIGTNTSGFSALLAGYRLLNGYFSFLRYNAYFWSSSEQSATTAASVYLFGEYPDIYFIDNIKEYGFSVRCVKDDSGSGGSPDSREGEANGRTNALIPGVAMPDIVLPDSSGKLIDARTIGAGRLLVVFYASSCPHCRTLLNGLNGMYNTRPRGGTDILAVSLDTDRDEWLGYVRDNSLKWVSVSDLRGWNGPVARRCRVSAIPTMVIVDRSMRILAAPTTLEEVRTWF